MEKEKAPQGGRTSDPSVQIPPYHHIDPFPPAYLSPPGVILSIDVNPACPEVLLRKLYLFHDLRVCLGYVVEGEDAPAELEEEVGAKGDEGP
jgi:hypothetical protein